MFQVGDVVVCVDDRTIDCGKGKYGSVAHLGRDVKKGRFYRVQGVTSSQASCRCQSLIVDGVTGISARFRKLRKADKDIFALADKGLPVREDA